MVLCEQAKLKKCRDESCGHFVPHNWTTQCIGETCNRHVHQEESATGEMVLFGTKSFARCEEAKE